MAVRGRGGDVAVFDGRDASPWRDVNSHAKGARRPTAHE